MFCTKTKKTNFRLDEMLNDEDFKGINFEDIISVLDKTSCLFQIEKIHGQYLIDVKITLKLCESYSNRGHCNQNCYKLHLCDNVILKKNCDKNCKLNHDIWSSHNKDIIRYKQIYTEPIAILKFYQVTILV